MMSVVKFSIFDNLRFLSHAETLRLFQRACTRAGIWLQYSSGFNPHPKLSLPLPRSVGVESDDELLVIHLEPGPNEMSDANYASQIENALSEQLPRGCRLLSVTITDRKISYHPRMVTYLLKLQRRSLTDDIRNRVRNLPVCENIRIKRRKGRKNAKSKVVDVRPFLKSIRLEDNGGDLVDITVECSVSPAGSIRVDEITKLLDLNVSQLAAPIRRTNVQWN